MERRRCRAQRQRAGARARALWADVIEFRVSRFYRHRYHRESQGVTGTHRDTPGPAQTETCSALGRDTERSGSSENPARALPRDFTAHSPSSCSSSHPAWTHPGGECLILTPPEMDGRWSWILLVFIIYLSKCVNMIPNYYQIRFNFN